MNLVSQDSTPTLKTKENVRQYLEQSVSHNTRRAYKSDLQHFVSWGGTIPCDDKMVTSYLADHAQILSIATLTRRLASISKAHTVKNMTSPTSSDLVKMTMRGIKRAHGKPQQRVSPILKEDLTAMLAHIQPGNKGTRDKALLLIGFAGALRRSELSAITYTDLEFVAQGLKLNIPRSKTDQSGEGRIIGIPFGRGRVCPVKALKDWLCVSEIKSGPVFRSVKKGGAINPDRLSTRAIADIIKHYAFKTGLDPSKYSGHSLRAGLVTSAAQNGISSWVIRRTTGHKSDAMLFRYIRVGDLFLDNAAGALF